MRGILAVAALVVWLLAAGAVALAVVRLTDDDGASTPVTVAPGPFLPLAPGPAGETQKALFEAAEAHDYARLGQLVSSELTYTFGAPDPGGPIAYWRRLERTTDERPLETLAALLTMPYAYSRDLYYWPAAHGVSSPGELSQDELEQLEPLGPLEELFVPGTGYVGWRVGIRPDGTWSFFVAGD
jgi:hypothetical protein